MQKRGLVRTLAEAWRILPLKDDRYSMARDIEAEAKAESVSAEPGSLCQKSTNNAPLFIMLRPVGSAERAGRSHGDIPEAAFRHGT